MPKFAGGPANGTQYEINAAYHQVITNEFRQQLGYGKGPYDPVKVYEVMLQVYENYPIPAGSATRGRR
jgi:hypothetical protein